jgi:hypothetical protein
MVDVLYSQGSDAAGIVEAVNSYAREAKIEAGCPCVGTLDEADCPHE